MRFPHIHLATSVVNRIKNIAQDIEALPAMPPQLPNVAVQGARLDQALAEPVQGVPAPPGSDTEAVAASLDGGTAADAVAGLGVLDAMP